MNKNFSFFLWNTKFVAVYLLFPTNIPRNSPHCLEHGGCMEEQQPLLPIILGNLKTPTFELASHFRESFSPLMLSGEKHWSFWKSQVNDKSSPSGVSADNPLFSQHTFTDLLSVHQVVDIKLLSKCMRVFYNLNHCEFWLKNMDLILKGRVATFDVPIICKPQCIFK